ncbi:MAG TPA: hypothetical protein VN327_05330 [Pseudonocardiaceae bacterium]|nr:hypothetical protein [Pseudonocardiaceae bacterium]
MHDMPAGALVRLYRIERRLSTVSLTMHVEVSPPTGQVLLASGLRSPSGGACCLRIPSSG